MTTLYKNRYIAPPEYTKWLFLSSLFFIIPAIYAYINNFYFYAIILLITSIVSANFWRKPTYSWRRNLDLVISKITFVIFTINGFIYIRSLYLMIAGYISLICLIYCYYLSEKYLKTKKNNWYKYHFIFHVLLNLELVIIIYSAQLIK